MPTLFNVDFDKLQPGDPLYCFGVPDPIVVKTVEVQGDWWMVEFGDGQNIKSIDNPRFLRDFSYLCPVCKSRTMLHKREMCQVCIDKELAKSN